MSSRALEGISRVVGLGLEADDVLRAVVDELAQEPEIEWAGILFLEKGELVLGPEAGVADPARRARVRVLYHDVVVGELAVDGAAESSMLADVASLISTYVLLGWDTGGEAWEA